MCDISFWPATKWNQNKDHLYTLHKTKIAGILFRSDQYYAVSFIPISLTQNIWD